MSVQSGPTFKRYAANGVTTVYAIPFLLLDAADLLVTLDGVEVVSGFVLTGVGNPSSTCTFSAAPTGDLLFQLSIPFQRLADYQENGDLLSGTLNNDLDRLWLAIKQLSGGNDRALSTGVLEPEGIPALPVAAVRALKLLAFDALGDPVASALTLSELEQQPALATAAAASASASAAAADASEAAAAGSASAAATSAANAITSETNAAASAAAAASAPIVVRGSFSNLKCSASGLSASVSIAADELVLTNSSNEPKVLRSVSVTPSFANAGVNGIDLGAANSQTANTWYYAWVIWNGTTTAGLLSLSASAPTLPAGYTHKALVGPVRTDGTGNKFPLSYTQGNDLWRYKLAAASNTPGYPLLTSGLQGTAPSTWASVSTANAAPPIASSIHISASATAQNSANTWLAPNSAHVTTLNAANTAPLAFLQPALNAGGAALNGVLPLESATISVIASGGASQSTYCTGFGINL